MRPRPYSDLVDLAHQLAGPGADALGVFDCASVGLLLEPREHSAGYESTPTNTDTFAYTGGDGVHYGFLLLADRAADALPVVMTVPMASANIIVGATFFEFLRLGCRNGYFSLEQLSYDWDGTVAHLQSIHEIPEHDEKGYLRAINERFGLTPWPDVAGCLAELQRLYLPLLRWDPDAPRRSLAWSGP